MLFNKGLFSPDSAGKTSDPKKAKLKHITMKCGWICLDCRKVERHRSDLQEHECNGSMVHKRVLNAGFMCQRCPCISDNHAVFREEECLGSTEVPSPSYGVAPTSARPGADHMPRDAARSPLSIRKRAGKIGGEYMELPVVPPSSKGSSKGAPKPAVFGKQGMHASASNNPKNLACKEPEDAIPTKTKPEEAMDPIPTKTEPEEAKDPIPTKTSHQEAKGPILAKTEPPKPAPETITKVATHKGWVDEPCRGTSSGDSHGFSERSVVPHPGKPITHDQRIEVQAALRRAHAELDQLLLLHALESERQKLEKLLLMKADSETCTHASGGNLSKNSSHIGYFAWHCAHDLMLC